MSSRDEDRLEQSLDDDAAKKRLVVFTARLRVLTALSLSLYAVAGVVTRSMLVMGAAIATALFLGTVMVANRLARRGEARRAALVTAYCLIAVASAGPWLVRDSLSVDVLVCIMAVVVALPHVTARDLARVIVTSVLAVAVMAAITVFHPIENVIPRSLLAPILLGTNVAGAYLVALSLRQYSVHLRDLLSRSDARMRELTRLQTELVRTERLAALGEAAAVVAHEVRNPLGVLVNVIELLKKDASVSQDARGLLALQAEEVSRLDRLVRDMLVLAKPLEPQFSVVAVQPLLRRVVESVSPLATERGVRLEMAVIDGAMALWGDPDFVPMALVNVVRNAVDVSPASGTVRVTASRNAEALRIDVEDEGTGIEEGAAARLFEPFFTTRRTGSGLGLAIVNRVMQVHGGAVRAHQRTGGGARFELHFSTPPGPLAVSSETVPQE